MPSHSSQIADAAYRAFDGVNELLAATDVARASDEAVVVGDGATFDSMGFVNFVVLLEEELERRLGRTVSVTSILSTVGQSGNSPLTLGQVVNLLTDQLGVG
jgi:Ethanolamine utilization protein EutJ (predicted chaperonin)